MLKVNKSKKLKTFFTRPFVSIKFYKKSVSLCQHQRYDRTNLTVVQNIQHLLFNSDKQRCCLLNDEQCLSLSELNVCIRFEQTIAKCSNLFGFGNRGKIPDPCETSGTVVLYVYESRLVGTSDSESYGGRGGGKDSRNFISLSSSNKMEKNYFKCFRLFLETGKKLDDSLKGKYYEALLEYGLNGIKPTDPIIDALLTSAMYSIDKTDEGIKKKSESMMGNANAVKNFEKVSKQKKTEKNRTEQKQTEKNIGRNKKNIEEKEEYEDKEEDTTTQTNIILSDDTDAKASEYGNADINKCLNLVKQYNGGLIDGTIKESRRYAKLLIDKLNKLESIQSGKYTREQTLEIILKVISNNKYYTSKITSTESIYRNLAVLMQACKKDISKQQGSTFILPTV